jgi:hypothetical protein
LAASSSSGSDGDGAACTEAGWAEAAAAYEQILKTNSQHVPALNNLAYVLLDVPARRVEALGYIDQAIQTAGRVPALLDTKGMIIIPITSPAARADSEDTDKPKE